MDFSDDLIRAALELMGFVTANGLPWTCSDETLLMLLQLNPSLPMDTPRGKGRALLVIDPGEDHHLLWTVALDETGEIWTFPNPEVRLQPNQTFGVRLEKDLQ